MYAWLLEDSAASSVNLSRVIKMLLLHDVVEVDAGDTPIHDNVSDTEQREKESLAARRLFSLLPEPQSVELHDLWGEFERAETNDARFAKALDRFQPLLTNIFTGGGTWAENEVLREQVLMRYGPVIERGAPKLWALAEQWVSEHFARRVSHEHAHG